MVELNKLLEIKLYTYPNLKDKIKFENNLRNMFIRDLFKLYYCELLKKSLLSFLWFRWINKPSPCRLLRRFVYGGFHNNRDNYWFYDKWHVYVESSCVWYIDRKRLDSDDDLLSMKY